MATAPLGKRFCTKGPVSQVRVVRASAHVTTGRALRRQCAQQLQALVLTAIVISFGMTALIVVLALRSYLEIGFDHVDGTSIDGTKAGS